MHYVLREESAQATVEYAIVTVALLSIVLRSQGFGVPVPMGVWRRWSSGRHLTASPRHRLSTLLRVLRTSCCIDVAREDRAQSTVEAAFLLPTFSGRSSCWRCSRCACSIHARSWSLPPPRPRGS